MPHSKPIQPRQVAVAIPYRTAAGTGSSSGDAKGNELEVLLVSSRKHDGKWVLPKGGVEEGESTLQAAVRELWEEGELLVAELVCSATTMVGTDELHPIFKPGSSTRPAPVHRQKPPRT